MGITFSQEQVRRRQIECNKKTHKRRKVEIICHYSNATMRCKKCKEDRLSCLTIDHIYGGGNKHRKKTGEGNTFYRWLDNNNYPDGFRVLCMNCNFCEYIDGNVRWV